MGYISIGFTTVNSNPQAPGTETPKVRSLQGTEGARDEGQGTSLAAEALIVPIASYRVYYTHYKPRIYKDLIFG